MSVQTWIIIGMIAMAFIFSEYESKNQKRMTKKRPCQFISREVITKFNNEQPCVQTTEKIHEGLFHRFADKIEYNQHHEPIGHTFAIVEDQNGNVHQVDPTNLQFLDK